ncbi:MAG: [FeFe] hydrogenase H-cluster maturation GTPase HydF [Odoribacter sp.]|nr:[FeFe] hydrogenase H-cluster maturation GTPase HydF [Odoribacter sp.]
MNKKYIVLTGRRNVGKSALINALTGQETAIVSDTAGTTTDPVKKAYEIPGYAPVVFIDTAGIDDNGLLGEKRTAKTRKAILQADIALLVFTGNCFGKEERQLISLFRQHTIPFLLIHNKSDQHPLDSRLKEELTKEYRTPVIAFSALQQKQPEEIIRAIQTLLPPSGPASLLDGLVHKNDTVLLVTPIDSEAPAGRLILPQVQTLREVLDRHCIGITVQPEELPGFLQTSSVTPRLVITDSQVFRQVTETVPPHIPLTSFSILMARLKGDFQKFMEGTSRISHLQDGDRVLILESCTHHVSCEDIGRVKIPALLEKQTGRKLDFDFVAGLDTIQRPVTNYALVIQCGGCMITSRQLQNRLCPAIEAGIPVSNYGMAIAYLQGIFERATAPFKRP